MRCSRSAPCANFIYVSYGCINLLDGCMLLDLIQKVSSLILDIFVNIEASIHAYYNLARGKELHALFVNPKWLLCYANDHSFWFLDLPIQCCSTTIVFLVY